MNHRDSRNDLEAPVWGKYMDVCVYNMQAKIRR